MGVRERERSEEGGSKGRESGIHIIVNGESVFYLSFITFYDVHSKSK